MVLDVWFVIWYWKLPQLEALGSTGNAFDSHFPTREADAAVLVPGPAIDAAGAAVDPGASTFVECSKAHPALTAVNARANRNDHASSIFITYPLRDARFYALPLLGSSFFGVKAE